MGPGRPAGSHGVQFDGHHGDIVHHPVLLLQPLGPRAVHQLQGRGRRAVQGGGVGGGGHIWRADIRQAHVHVAHGMRMSPEPGAASWEVVGWCSSTRHPTRQAVPVLGQPEAVAERRAAPHGQALSGKAGTPPMADCTGPLQPTVRHASSASLQPPTMSMAACGEGGKTAGQQSAGATATAAVVVIEAARPCTLPVHTGPPGPARGQNKGLQIDRKYLTIDKFPDPVCGQQQPLVLRAQLHGRRLRLCSGAAGGMGCRIVRQTGVEPSCAEPGAGKEVGVGGMAWGAGGRRHGLVTQQLLGMQRPVVRWQPIHSATHCGSRAELPGCLPGCWPAAVSRHAPEDTPTVWATMSPMARLMARPGTQESASHTRLGPTGCPRASASLRRGREAGRLEPRVKGGEKRRGSRAHAQCGGLAELRQACRQRSTATNALPPPPPPRAHRCTRPPAPRMRAFSSGWLGLWSRVSGMARRPRGSCTSAAQCRAGACRASEAHASYRCGGQRQEAAAAAWEHRQLTWRASTALLSPTHAVVSRRPCRPAGMACSQRVSGTADGTQGTQQGQWHSPPRCVASHSPQLPPAACTQPRCCRCSWHWRRAPAAHQHPAAGTCLQALPLRSARLPSRCRRCHWCCSAALCWGCAAAAPAAGRRRSGQCC